MKWRKYKKKFKKDIKPKMEGMYIGVDNISYVPMKIKDVKIRPAGHKQVEYTHIVEPLDEKMFRDGMEKEKPKDRVEGFFTIGEQYVKENGYDITFDIPRPIEKTLLSLMGL